MPNPRPGAPRVFCISGAGGEGAIFLACSRTDASMRQKFAQSTDQTNAPAKIATGRHNSDITAESQWRKPNPSDTSLKYAPEQTRLPILTQQAVAAKLYELTQSYPVATSAPSYPA